MLLTVNGNIREKIVEPTEIIVNAINKLSDMDNAGELQAAIPDLINILTASASVPDLTTNGFGLAIIELSKSIVGEE